MRAVILAAGRGKRMESLTQANPKCLLEVQGKALLDWQIEAIRFAGIKEIGIVTGYKRELLANRGLIEFHNERWPVSNMVESLSMAQSWLQESPCMVSYSDILYGQSAVHSLVKSKASIAITYDPNWLDLWQRRFGDPLEDAETFRLSPESTVVEIGGKPVSVTEVEGQYMGLLRLTPEGWAEASRIRSGFAKQERDNVQMTTLLQKITDAKRVQIEAIPYLGAWAEFDNGLDFRALADTKFHER